MDFAAYHLRILIDLDLLSKDAALLVLFLDELVPDLEGIDQSFVLAYYLGLVLLQGHHDSLVGNFVGLNSTQALLDGLLASLVRGFHRHFLRRGVRL